MKNIDPEQQIKDTTMAGTGMSWDEMFWGRDANTIAQLRATQSKLVNIPTAAPETVSLPHTIERGDSPYSVLTKLNDSKDVNLLGDVWKDPNRTLPIGSKPGDTVHLPLENNLAINKSVGQEVFDAKKTKNPMRLQVGPGNHVQGFPTLVDQLRTASQNPKLYNKVGTLIDITPAHPEYANYESLNQQAIDMEKIYRDEYALRNELVISYQKAHDAVFGSEMDPSMKLDLVKELVSAEAHMEEQLKSLQGTQYHRHDINHRLGALERSLFVQDLQGKNQGFYRNPSAINLGTDLPVITMHELMRGLSGLSEEVYYPAMNDFSKRWATLPDNEATALMRIGFGAYGLTDDGQLDDWDVYIMPMNQNPATRGGIDTGAKAVFADGSTERFNLSSPMVSSEIRTRDKNLIGTPEWRTRPGSTPVLKDIRNMTGSPMDEDLNKDGAIDIYDTEAAQETSDLAMGRNWVDIDHMASLRSPADLDIFVSDEPKFGFAPEGEVHGIQSYDESGSFSMDETYSKHFGKAFFMLIPGIRDDVGYDESMQNEILPHESKHLFTIGHHTMRESQWFKNNPQVQKQWEDAWKDKDGYLERIEEVTAYGYTAYMQFRRMNKLKPGESANINGEEEGLSFMEWLDDAENHSKNEVPGFQMQWEWVPKFKEVMDKIIDSPENLDVFGRMFSKASPQADQKKATALNITQQRQA